MNKFNISLFMILTVFALNMEAAKSCKACNIIRRPVQKVVKTTGATVKKTAKGVKKVGETVTKPLQPKKDEPKKEELKKEEPKKLSAGKLVTITSQKQFEELRDSGKALVVEVSIDGCPACEVLAPRIKQLAGKRSDLTVAKINATSLNFIRKEYGLTGFPTILYFKDGKLNGKEVGSRSLASLEKEAQRYIGV